MQETLAGTNSYTYDDANPVSLRSRDERPPHGSRWGELHLVRQPPSASLLGAGGNLLSDGASTYTFDHAREASPKRSGGGNRLSSIAQGDDTYSYVYPAQNMRGERQRPGRPPDADGQRRSDQLHAGHRHRPDAGARRRHERLPLPR